ELLAFNCDRALQTFEHDHAHSPRAPIRKFGTGEWRILAGHAKTVGLVAGLTICRKNLFAWVVRRKFSLLAAAWSACDCFLRRGRRTHWIQAAGDEISLARGEQCVTQENHQGMKL